jgi:flagellar protein FliS
MTAAGYAGYRNVIAKTIEKKEDILLMLFEGALSSVRIAQRGIAANNPKLKGENISRVLAILTELDCALDLEKGGDVARNLATLYDYMIKRLTHANIKNDPDALKEVERLLCELQEGFKAAAKTAAPPVYAPDAESEAESGLTGGLRIAV